MEEEIAIEEQEKGFNKKLLIIYIVSFGVLLTIGVVFGLLLYFLSLWRTTNYQCSRR